MYLHAAFLFFLFFFHIVDFIFIFCLYFLPTRACIPRTLCVQVYVAFQVTEVLVAADGAL